MLSPSGRFLSASRSRNLQRAMNYKSSILFAGVSRPTYAAYGRPEAGRVCRGAAGYVLQSTTDAESGRAFGQPDRHLLFGLAVADHQLHPAESEAESGRGCGRWWSPATWGWWSGNARSSAAGITSPGRSASAREASSATAAIDARATGKFCSFLD